MKKVVLVLILFIFADCCPNSSEAEGSINVRVMAANLNGGQQSYQPFAIRIFQGLKPDVVAIQEFNYNNDDFRGMVDLAFGTNFAFYREPFDGNGDIPNGIISRYPIVGSGSWSDAVQSQPNRGFAWAQIQLPGTNTLYVVSVHLLTSTSAARAAEATALKSQMQSTFPANAWVVLAGDFNTDSGGEPAMQTFTTYLSNFPVPVDNNGNTNTSINRNHPHDYVLPSFTLTNYETATVYPTHTYPKGLVFDSRVYTGPNDLDDFAPVQLADSGLAQHMAVIKDFIIPGGTNFVANVPSISAQPQSLSVVQGSNAMFTVTATGASSLAYQWFFGSTNIPGATTNVYALAGVQVTNAGNYSVIVTNSAGSVTSSVAVLTVITAPVITTNPAPLTVIQGGTANYSVAAIGILPLSYQWRFNGTNISGATTNPFTFANAQPADAGNYSVLITNVAGSVTSSIAALTVTFAATGSVGTLAGWDMSALSNYGPSPMAPTTNLPVLTVGGLTRGSGVGTGGTAAGRTWGGSGFSASTAAGSTNASAYATFTIAANAGYTVSFTSLNKYDYKKSPSGPASGVLQYRIGTGPYSDVTTFSFTSTSGASLGPVDLSGIAALQNIAPSNTVTFRFVNYGASSSGGNWYIFDVAGSTAPDLAVQGIINLVPPPAAAVLAAAIINGSQIGFNITGSTNASYVVQTSTNLGATNWLSVFTNVPPFSFVDTNVFGPQRFYRVISQ